MGAAAVGDGPGFAPWHQRTLDILFLERLFQGSLSGMVSHLLSTHEVSADELAELERLIAERKRAR
jgi:predicted transcriptional regulator